MVSLFRLVHPAALLSLPLLLLLITQVTADDQSTPVFVTAKPIWPKGMEKTLNCAVGFQATFTASRSADLQLRLTGSSVYRLFLNGEFIGYGPARGPLGFHRIDEWPLGKGLRNGRNVLYIEVIAYNVNSYYLVDQPGFLQAEVVADGKVLASTGGAGSPFRARLMDERVQKMQRYSFQRPFLEMYRLNPDFDQCRVQPDAPFQEVKCTATEAKRYLPRRVPFPTFSKRPARVSPAAGRLEQQPPVGKVWQDRALTDIGPRLGGFPQSELSIIPSLEMQRYRSVLTETTPCAFEPGQSIALDENGFRIFDLGVNLTGFVGARVHCDEPTQLWFLFDEILVENDVDFKRMSCVNIIPYELAPGDYQLENAEPYTMRYIKAVVLKGSCTLADLYLREFVNPEAHLAQFSCSDRHLNRLFEAARETFRQNAVDLFTDCPGRERSGWLCDSYFTSRVAMDLCGNTAVEKNFLENFLLATHFPGLPEGMLPMCYPADHPDSNFIPNWALWFVVQLEEYQARSGDRALVQALQPRVDSLFSYLAKLKNSDGLLEKLPAWVFVEWSKANSFVQDVNYPSNMLYAGALDVAGRLYGRSDYSQQAVAVRETIRRQSFDGEFFVDNAVRGPDGLTVTRNRSEACQYYAFYFGVATPESHAGLWQKLVKEFGPKRKETNAYPDVHPANTFIGDYLRLELLSRAGLVRQILSESKDFFLYMAERTGTLWENRGTNASTNHGFASHIAHILVRDVLGVRTLDIPNKKIALRLAPIPLDWCEARLPLPDGQLSVRWWFEQGVQKREVICPQGWVVEE